MLKVDLNEGRYDIVRQITNDCAPFGDVHTVTLFLESAPTAVIEMSTLKDTEALALKLGGRLVGNTAFITLSQRPVETMRAQAG